MNATDKMKAWEAFVADLDAREPKAPIRKAAPPPLSSIIETPSPESVKKYASPGKICYRCGKLWTGPRPECKASLSGQLCRQFNELAGAP